MKTKLNFSKVPFFLTFGLLLIVSNIFSQTKFEVTAPVSISGTYDFSPAAFGGDFPDCGDVTPISGELVLVEDNSPLQAMDVKQ